MVVEITNITDGPGKTPTQIDLYNKTLNPGATLKLPAALIDKKVRALEECGLIAIGQVPPWYVSAKTKNGRPLTPEERQRRIAPTAVTPSVTPAVTSPTEPVQTAPQTDTPPKIMVPAPLFASPQFTSHQSPSFTARIKEEFQEELGPQEPPSEPTLDRKRRR